MNIAESTVANAIRYCMRKYCHANIIIAGPIGAGKIALCNEMKDWFEAIEGSNVAVLSQYNYYKELEDIPCEKYGKKIDSIEAFEKEEFIDDVKEFLERGYTYTPHYYSNWSRKNPIIIQADKMNHKVEILHKGHINIFVGPHAITLLKGIVVDAITIYVNTTYSKCIARRVDRGLFLPMPCELEANLQVNYFESFVLTQIAEEIFPQLDEADLVVKLD